MPDPKEVTEPAPSSLRRAAVIVTEGKFGSRHAWDFDVPAWTDLVNSMEKLLPPHPGIPLSEIREADWAVLLTAVSNEQIQIPC